METVHVKAKGVPNTNYESVRWETNDLYQKLRLFMKVASEEEFNSFLDQRSTDALRDKQKVKEVMEGIAARESHWESRLRAKDAECEKKITELKAELDYEKSKSMFMYEIITVKDAHIVHLESKWDHRALELNNKNLRAQVSQIGKQLESEMENAVSLNKKIIEKDALVTQLEEQVNLRDAKISELMKQLDQEKDNVVMLTKLIGEKPAFTVKLHSKWILREKEWIKKLKETELELLNCRKVIDITKKVSKLKLEQQHEEQKFKKIHEEQQAALETLQAELMVFGQ